MPLVAGAPRSGNVQLQFIGSGDAFGSGGRFNTCFMVSGARSRFLIDCGASSLVALKRFSVDPNSLDAILISHLHGDHFGGLPFFLLDAQFVSRRRRPLLIAGPPGLERRLAEAQECFFPGSSANRWRFDLTVEEFAVGQRWQRLDLAVLPVEVSHCAGAPSLALRIECDGKVIAYSGDTEWTESLIPAARDADLFIAEAYFYDKKGRYHLDYKSLTAHLDRIRPKRLILTHMSVDMLARLDGLDCESATDGAVIDLG